MGLRPGGPTSGELTFLKLTVLVGGLVTFGFAAHTGPELFAVVRVIGSGAGHVGAGGTTRFRADATGGCGSTLFEGGGGRG